MNQLSGEIPPEIGNLKNLAILYITRTHVLDIFIATDSMARFLQKLEI